MNILKNMRNIFLPTQKTPTQFLADNLVELPIVVVITSFNNKHYYERNLSSVFSQKYHNYRVIYVNDCSNDHTGELVEEYIKKLGQESRTTLINNTTRKGALCNLYHAIHSCADNEIVATLDGDDWFAHDKVLARVNQEYANNTTWLTYGQFTGYPRRKKGLCRAMPRTYFINDSPRNHPWVASHLRTFYAWLYKQIDQQDLMFNGEFYSVAWDFAMMFPMLEMAGFEHVRFIPDILYIYNEETPLNDWKKGVEIVQSFGRIIRAKQWYMPLKNSPSHMPTTPTIESPTSKDQPL